MASAQVDAVAQVQFPPQEFPHAVGEAKKKNFSPKFSLSFIPVLISKQDKNNQIPPGKSLIPRCLIGYWVYTENHQVGIVTSLFCLPLCSFPEFPISWSISLGELAV